MIAIKRMQSIMWILVIAMGALAAYLISLRVATERNAVTHLIDEIRWTRSDIRYLEAEFGARASMRQLSAWNQNDLRLYVPGPAQYLPNERALATLDRIEPVDTGTAPPPVMTAMATQAQTQGAAQTVDRPASSEFSLIRAASAAELTPAPVAAAPVRKEKAKPADGAKPVVLADAKPMLSRPVAQPDPASRKAARLALLDEKLLGGSGAPKIGSGKASGSDSKVR